ncbi:MAG TPA: tetratricopeptide repeat protein [Candidatus Methanoperedens sp.]|nr:tetratricopeptide repeat protein [Candidatus Methanoperedens sp.]
MIPPARPFRAPYRASTSLAALALTALVVAVYARVTTLGFVFDDSSFFDKNPFVRRGLTADGLRWALTANVAGIWHPLTLFSLMLDVELFGVVPAAHHAVNVVLHLLSTLVLFAVLERMTGATWRSAAVAALFAAHPLHVESVAWIAERKDVLSTFCGLLALGAWTRYAERPGAARYLAALFLFLLSLAAKPMLVTLPFVLLLLDFWPLARRGGRPVFLEKVPLLLLSTIVSIVAVLTQRAHGAMSLAGAYALEARAANATVAAVAYLGKTVWPVGLAVMYPHPGTALPAWQGFSAAGFLALALAAALRFRRRSPWLLTGLLWFLGTLVPVIGLVQIGEQARADRYTYVPLIGLFLAAAWGVAPVAERLGMRRLLAAGTLLAVLACGFLSARQLSYWQDNRTLYQHAVDVAPGSWMMHANLAAELLNAGEVENAALQMREVVRLKPQVAAAHNNLASVLERQGHAEEAAREYAETLRWDSLHPTADGRLGAVLLRLGRSQEALPHLERAVRIRPTDVEARISLGLALFSAGRMVEALAALQVARQLAPGRADAHNYAGAALENLGRHAEAAAALAEAVRLQPGNGFYRSRLQTALARTAGSR